MKNLDRSTQLLTLGVSRTLAPSRRLPWAVLLALPLALMALLWATAHGLPTAAANGLSTITYAGCATVDPTLTPNFATIQQAVDATAPGGVVNICPGLYNESVDLSQMNGGGTGGITLRKYPGAAGTVDWTSNSNHALYVTGIFSGNVVLQDLFIHDAAGDGVSFGQPSLAFISGSVTISNVQSFRNHGSGIGFGGDGSGFLIFATQGITIFHATADQNALVGFGLMGDAGAPIYLRNLQANGNNFVGILVAQDGAVDLLDSQANENGSLLLPIPFAAGVAILQGGILNSAALGLPSDFMAVSSSVALAGDAYIRIEDTDAAHNVGFGFLVLSLDASIHMTGATAIDNGFDGVAAAVVGFPGSIMVNDSVADNNGWLYLQLANAGADVTASGLFGPSAGFLLSADQIAVDGASASANQDYGFCLASFGGAIAVANSRTENNAADGILHDLDICQGVVFSGVAPTGDVTPQVSPGTVFISNTTSSGNVGTGISIDGDSATMTVTNVTAQNNGTGILVNLTTFLDSSLPSNTPVQIDNSLIQGNTDSGVAFEEFIDFLPQAVMAVTAPTAVIAGNIICENGAGLTVNTFAPAGEVDPAFLLPSAVVADARGNWWGNTSGPNPPGTGDAIITGTAVVNASPWINTFLTGAVPNPTIAGYPTLADFQFADASQTYFLQEGVGNLNEPPIFTISSDNGAIATAAAVSQFLHNGFLSVVVTPSVPSDVLISVAGPCGLNPFLSVPVANPQVSITKSPDLQKVPAGAKALFDIVVENTGNITLTEIAVSDALAPACNATAGAISDLGPGDTATYSCEMNVATALVNTAQVEAQALVNNEPSGIVLNDTDTAAVELAHPAVNIRKSPDVQGVPVGGNAPFTITIANTGDIPLTKLAVIDALAPNCNRTVGALEDLAPGASTEYPCVLSGVSANLLNAVQVKAEALVRDVASGVVVTASDTAQVLVGSLTLTRTVWVDGYNPACQTIDKSLTKVPAGTPVKYCFTVTNTGSYTFTTHSLNDSRLAAIFGGFAHDLPPGASYSNIDAGFPATETITADITGVTTWTGTLDGPIQQVSVAAAANQVDAAVTRAIAISLPGDDQDGDGVDDITEGYGDVNSNGAPDFLDPTPTGEEEEPQPRGPNKLLLPTLNH